MPASAYLPSSLLLDSTLSPFPGSTPYPPAKQWMKKFPSCSKLPIAFYLGCSTLNAGRPSSAPLQVCPRSVLCFPPKIFPGHIFLPKLRYLSHSQSHPKALRPDDVHWNGCNGCSVYTTNPPGFLPGRRVNSLDTPLTPFLLYFAYGNPNPSEGSVGITNPRQIGGP
ncbi:hypothetical protein B0H14DRAFT_1594324 [Mycena olivaceomarginata]|nr:hypothetical protein B0H14DRAFT_1594324 [Mycena olivaceomarginata]